MTINAKRFSAINTFQQQNMHNVTITQNINSPVIIFRYMHLVGIANFS